MEEIKSDTYKLKLMRIIAINETEFFGSGESREIYAGRNGNITLIEKR
jgi:hypothetical protein